MTTIALVLQDAFSEPLGLQHEAEEEGLEGVGEEDGGDHADEGADADGVDGGVAGKEHGEDHDYQYECREEYCALMVVQKGLVLPSRVGEKAVHHEDAVVDSYTEYEGRYDDVDQIELQAEQSHESLDDVPAEEHREERQQRYPYIAEREQQDDEHEYG